MKSVAIFLLLLAGLFLLNCDTKDQSQLRFAMAAARGDAKLVNELLKSGVVDINAQNGEIGPALVSASYGGHKDVVKLLLNSGANINVKDKKGTTPLMNAVIGEKPEIVRLLLENRADTTIAIEKTDANNNPITAITFAKMKHNQEILNMLEAESHPK